MPWSCRILLRHHQTENVNAIAQTLCPNCFLSICQGAQISAIWEFSIFGSSKFTNEANFPTLNICIKSMKAQNGLKLPLELFFGIMNVTKYSYLLNSKVAFLKSGQNAARICPLFHRWCIFLKSAGNQILSIWKTLLFIDVKLYYKMNGWMDLSGLFDNRNIAAINIFDRDHVVRKRS